ncbi:succinylglutamate desuccinylase/aspartoacylase family protein [Cyclobacterium salsum]|uniref:succinylglutamate desuccinylase/aspartoacylase family protein n=1 Tax=Cyclobacterium salsum TaxID=2666329 RepID=UPI001391C292|nr:succinylglutamate desuccinylase/aspartoacylase family protein [Cyclobacterium salsum]
MPESLLTTNNPRILFAHHQDEKSPTLVVIAGIHGNEPASVMAMEDLFGEQNIGKFSFQGNVMVLKGNNQALKRKQRYIEKDLNRIWTKENLNLVRMKDSGEAGFSYPELEELASLDHLITSIIAKYNAGKMLFTDLHTTSSESCAFLPFNDTLVNRSAAKKFPVPLILGIEEYLEGPLMSHINDLGYPALGFEAGKHENPDSIRRHQAFVKLCMNHLGIIQLTQTEKELEEGWLRSNLDIPEGFYEILCRYPISPEQDFRMNPGFFNFNPIRKGHELARNNGEPVISPYRGMVFLPLYQQMGQEGFFIVRPVSTFWLWLSKIIRKTFLPEMLPLLPGISRKKNHQNRYTANPKIARWLNKEIFHLLGFRIVMKDPDSFWELVKRE